MPTAMTITPDGFVDETSGEFVQTGHTVEGSQIKEQQRTEETQLQEERFYEDEDGQTHYNHQVSEDDYQNLLDGYGEETFSQVTQWAENTFSQEEIDSYDAIVNNGDLVEIAEAMETVYKMWTDRNLEPDQTDTQVTQEDSDTNWVFTEVMPQAEYEELVSYARDNFDDSFIDNYNLIVQSGDKNMIQKTIQLLKTKVNEERA